MDLPEFFPTKEGQNEINDSVVTNKESHKKVDKISQEQLYDIITSKEVSWQALIYELIQTEQLDPWDIDISLLAQKYLEKIKQLEEANFFVSSKVLLAASLLLRIKSEILLNRYIKSIDDILFGKKDEEKKPMERIEIDEDELPELMPRTPLPRYRQVTLHELMQALGNAMNTENRRIRREVAFKSAEKLSKVDIPHNRINVRDRIRHIYARIRTYLSKKPENKISYSELVGNTREERIAAFLPVLHLENQQKIWLEQEKHFDEIWIFLYEFYKKQAWEKFDEELREMESNLKEEMNDEQKKRIEKINKDFENPLANFFDMTSEIMKGDK